MATQTSSVTTIYQDVLANYLISMARTVENSVDVALDALLHPSLEAANALSSKVFLVEREVSRCVEFLDQRWHQSVE